MLFFEYSFIFVFLPLTLIGYYLLPHSVRNHFLLFASCIFYAFSNWVFLPLLWLSVIVDYVAGKRIYSTNNPMVKRRWLILSITTNLGILASFKYIWFITSNLQSLFGSGHIPLIEALLPVGISFYTFQSMSYTIDLYRGKVKPVRSLFDFATFVTMFPQLIAGPIVRYAQINKQILSRSHTLEKLASGVALFIIGLAKKILIADTLAILSTPLFANPDPSFTEAWIAILMFAGQIYFDFSGYSDMAIGLGRMFGFELPVNFNSPYKATSFRDFWRRWHISLSTWLRDYLYVPLGGNRKGPTRTFLNLFITMFLGGLWHGASWNFALWGTLHGLFLAIERLSEEMISIKIPTILKRFAVFVAVLVAWVPFKFEDIDNTLTWYNAMALGSDSVGTINLPQVIGAIGLLLLIWLPTNTSEWKIDFRPAQLTSISSLLVAALFVAYGRIEISPFLYFRF